jgi:hypothetical protein
MDRTGRFYKIKELLRQRKVEPGCGGLLTAHVAPLMDRLSDLPGDGGGDAVERHLFGWPHPTGASAFLRGARAMGGKRAVAPAAAGQVRNRRQLPAAHRVCRPPHDALHCQYDGGDSPKIIRLHFVRDELLAAQMRAALLN